MFIIKMKIALIGPGIMSIPPTGWGAVEALIWDYYRFLTAMNQEVIVINTKDKKKIVESVNSGDFDFVHLHYDCFVDIIPMLKTKIIAITSHYPYITGNHETDYKPIFKQMIEYTNSGLCYIFALTMPDLLSFVSAGCDKQRIFICRNGVSEEITFNSKAKTKKSIYLAKIEPRKRQHLINDLENIECFGRLTPGYITPRNYKGEMTKKEVYAKLTEYSNLVLLSESESNPLVVMEAMMAGLGVVLSEKCGYSQNKFITIIEESKIHNQEYIREKIRENRRYSIKHRSEIRQYAIDNFSWNKILENYLQTINFLLPKKTKKYAFLFTGQLRTYLQCIPHWHDLFRRLKPDLYLFIDDQSNKYSLDHFKSVFGNDVNIVLLHFWTEADKKDYFNKRKNEDIHSCQFYFLQRISQMIKFEQYDVLAKFRFDNRPNPDRPFFIDAPWDKPEEVAPYLKSFWQINHPADFYQEGRLHSYHQYGESLTLGGAYVLNKEEEYKNIDLNRVIWTINDFITWSTPANMIKMMSSIFDNYSAYNYGLKYDWTPEATLIYHCKAVGLQPLMIMAANIVR